MKVIALREFNDKKAGTKRRVGDIFTVNKARYDEIMAFMPDLVAEHAPDEKKQPKSRTGKAAKRGSSK